MVSEYRQAPPMGRPGTNAAMSAVVAVLAFTSALAADGISETNYLHIDRDRALVADGQFEASSIARSPQTSGDIEIGSVLRLGITGTLSLAARAGETDTFGILFAEPICAIGVKVHLPRRDVRNSIQVDFRFLSQDGTLVDHETRWPALGTTLQAFGSDTFASRFSGVEIVAQTKSELAIGDILALPCAASIS